VAKGFNKRFATGNGQPKPVKIPAKARFMAFTQKYEGLTNRIVTPIGLTPAFDPNDYPMGNIPFPITQKNALWDTGATASVLTSATVKELKLTPIGSTTINHAGGTSQSNTYLVNFILPNQVQIFGLTVSECEDIVGGVGAIIGMDIISRGDFSITNVNQKTWISFRVPSMQSIDYVESFNRLTKNR
jgi:hypothetical protein